MNFYYLFLKKCGERGVSPSRAAEEAGIRKTSVSRWKTGTIPSDATLQKLAMYFGCSIDELRPSATPDDEEKEMDGQDMADKTETGRDLGELLDMLETLRDREDMRMLFNVTKKSSPESVMKLAEFLKGLEPDGETD